MTARIAVVLAVLVALTGTTAAQSLEEGDIAVIQLRPVLVRNRVEVLPRFGVTLNDPLIRQYHVGGSLYYHINEDFSVGGSFEWYDFGGALGGPTDAYNRMIQTSSSIPELAPLTYVAAAEFGWVPVNGKFSLFNLTIVYFDLYLLGGAGIIDTVGDPHPAGILAVGQRLFVTDWLALLIELRDRLYLEPYPSGNSFMNILTASIGVSVFIPPSFSYAVHRDRILDWD
ncbi:MAG: outer membrane beta-barrel domain-containing protein [Bradymonadales bacterium]|nr:outer membrane beta-barrel domain-containing protein [Bradymonadales bacterium]